MQTTGDGPSVLFHASLSGLFERSTERISSAHLEASWSADLTEITTGDFNGDGRADLILRPRGVVDDVVVGWAGESGMLGTSDTAFRIVADAHDLNWSADASNLLIGNFTGQDSDGGYRQDVLVRV